ncbi:MAG: glutaredoxin [Chloroflexi bacterium]|nr:glutaredoxin [Chloroflexota bacterium]
MAETTQPQIVAYLKPVCGWSNGVRAVFRKYGLEYEDKDIINDRSNYSEMVRKSGQPLSPCVEINGEMLGDVSGPEVEEYLIEKGLVKAPVEA